jgi:hypothetical protein
LETAIAAEINKAVAFAEADPWEAVDLLKDVRTPSKKRIKECEIK